MVLEQRKGFILTAEHRDRQNTQDLIFYGSSDEGPFQIKITDNKPLFFIEREVDIDVHRLNCERKAVPLRSSTLQAVDALYFTTQKSLLEARDSLQTQGIRTYEADVRPCQRFLMERFINGSLEWQGEGTLGADGVSYFVDAKIKKADYFPKFSILSLDIETSMGNDLYSIGLHFKKAGEEVKKVFMLGKGRETRSDILEIYPSEKALLQEFLEFVRIHDPDLFIGWHVIGFDLAFLERKAMSLGMTLSLGRDGSRLRISERPGAGYFAHLAGRIVVDGPQTLRGAFYKFENFKLDTVAQELLGIGKDISSGAGKVAEIQRRFHEDKDALAKYNLLDCTLVHDIYEKIDLIHLVVTRSIISGLSMDRIGVSTGAFDHYYLPRFHRKGFVASNIVDIQRESHASGGHVIAPTAGLYQHVVVLDFKSLYPSIIRTFKIDPLARINKHIAPLQTPVGPVFSQTEHLLPDFISSLLEQRATAQENSNSALAQAIKILMNSFYGVMGSTGSRFYHADLPTAITGTGQWLLKQTIQYLQSNEYEVLYGDTDSVFVQLKDKSAPFVQGEKLVVKINHYLKQLIKTQFKIDSHLEIQFEKYYRKFFLPPARHEGVGVKKKYAGLKVTRNAEELEFIGMEVVRSDWTKLAKEFQKELFRRAFYDEEIESWIKNFVDDVKAQKYDDQLIYKKRLTKPPEDYTKNIPPHVKAALLLEKPKFGYTKEVSYVISKAGPVPVGMQQTELDYQHYIDKQIRPLADNILFLYGKTFDNIVIGDQLSLF